MPMIIHEYDEVILDTGNKATILDIIGEHERYVAEICYKDTAKNMDMFSVEFVYPSQIKKVIRKGANNIDEQR